MKFRSYGAEIVSDVALGRRQNEPESEWTLRRNFNFQTPQNSALKKYCKRRPRAAPSPRVNLVSLQIQICMHILIGLDGRLQVYVQLAIHS